MLPILRPLTQALSRISGGLMPSSSSPSAVFASVQCLAQRPNVVPARSMGKYPKYDGQQLPGYILPRTRRKGAWYGHKLKMKWYRLRFGKTGQRGRRPGYGKHLHILSKCNI
ncbi:hypothetical protein SeMB42_g00800 [Synchytrium endobioticum]|uniref:Uncharacterized protein n=1 Tax=Synchytrium endobioticum TaxID=286115 RepID=A0A507DNY3_9FUNG|nr:hypothetical protein SeMB42_g00800 [Synchytrium endobioticum]